SLTARTFRTVASKNHLRLPALSLPERLPQERKSFEGELEDESEMSITWLRARQAANARWGCAKALGERSLRRGYVVPVRAFLETRHETRDLDRVSLVKTAYQYAHEIWPDDPAVLREHAERVARLAEYRTAFD